MTDPLNISISDDNVATITLNRPDVHNAFNDDLIWELNNNFTKLDADPAIRAIVLTGTGKSFSAGADLEWMKAAAAYSASENVRDAKALSDMLHAVYTCSKPTIAAVNGNAFGGGVGLIACCDIAIAVENALFALSEVRLGLVPATIGPYVMKVIGERACRRYFQTAERVTAEEALSLGLIQQTAPNLQAAFKLVGGHIKNILSGAPEAIAASKQLIQDISGQEITEDLRMMTADCIAKRRATDEAKEGLAAFLEKRTPSWTQS